MEGKTKKKWLGGRTTVMQTIRRELKAHRTRKSDHPLLLAKHWTKNV